VKTILTDLKALKFQHFCALSVKNRATNDPDEQLRQWAQEQLEMQNVTLESEHMP
jgi:hypothetical protein